MKPSSEEDGFTIYYNTGVSRGLVDIDLMAFITRYRLQGLEKADNLGGCLFRFNLKPIGSCARKATHKLTRGEHVLQHGHNLVLVLWLNPAVGVY